ncbi:hypothetical protein [Infirmifilum sp. SLHALR2]|nr:MAG: hypothetical protein B7L53_01730 [Thermofilum sp. NZ13]
MPSIVLSGCDGSGKTTLSRVLASYLSRYRSVRVFWFRGSHLLASLLLRILSRFRAFRGGCNPYYGVCIPGKLKWLWIHIEFWSAVPYILLRMVLGRLYRFNVFDRGVVDFVAWVIATLGYPGFLSSLYGRFLARLALREDTVYLHAGRGVLVERADVSPGFIYREYAVYGVLMRYLARCSIDTGLNSPVEAAVGVLKCMGLA